MTRRAGGGDDRDKWQWDIVTWSVIALLVAFAIMVTMLLRSHSSEDDFEEHLRHHTRAECASGGPTV